MAFSYDNFLKPVNPGDRVLQIYDSQDTLLYSVNIFSITNTQVYSNLVKINLKSGRLITLDFLDSNIAKSALSLLQNQLEILKSKKPFLIDKQIENYLEDSVSVEVPSGDSNFIPKWQSPKVLSSSSSIYDDGLSIKIYNDFVPIKDYTDPTGGVNLGSPSLRWENIYVKDAFIASQSLYLDTLKVYSEDSQLVVDGKAINKYEAYSSTTLTIGVSGEISTLVTDKNLSYVVGDSVRVSNGLENFYEADDYSEESIYKFFVGSVDYYNRDTGQMNLVVTFTNDNGFSGNNWYLKFATDILSNGNQGMQGIQGPAGGGGGGSGSQGFQGPAGGGTGSTGNQGVQGNIGLQGTQGFQGFQGTQGSQGSRGFQGLIGQSGADSASVLNSPVDSKDTLTVTHSYGNYPLVQVIDNSGYIVTSTNYTVLHSSTDSYSITFSSPFVGYVITGGGLTGPIGNQGVQGFYGNTGFQGVQGTQGNQGLQGLDGSTGSQGYQGITGNQGPAGGGTGNQGQTGPQGATGSGVQGVQGSQGVTGEPGAQGQTGYQGSTGSGEQGVQGVQGFTGFQGTQGIQGITGIGVQGFTGFQGVTGSQGITGAQGVTGPTITSFTFSNDIISIVLSTVTYSVSINSFVNLSTNTVTVNNFVGSSNRVVETTTTGSLTASRNIYNTYITDLTAQSQITTPSNWTILGVWAGPTVANVYAGQRHYDTNYLYEAITGNGSTATFIRLIRG